MADRFGIEYVYKVLNIEAVRMHVDSFDVVCPVCGHKCLNINVVKDVYNCPACGESGSKYDLAALFWKCDREEAYKRLNNGYGKLNAAEKQKVYKRTSDNKSRVIKQPAAPEVRDQAYRKMLDLIKLSDKHMENLVKRGLTEEDIRINMYRSFPQTNLGGIGAVLEAEKVQLDGVPGFYKKYGGYSLVAYKPGILIPVKDENGLISGFQVRMDEVPEGGSKYIWLSSTGKRDGQGITGCRNISVTRYDGDGSVPRLAFITEGPLKMDVVRSICAQHKKKTPFYGIALTGVANQGQLPDILQILKKKGLQTVYEVIDMDLLEKPQVKRAAENIDRKVREAGLGSIQLKWEGHYKANPELKGYDDYLLWMRDRKKRS